MSWSVQALGKPAAVAVAIDDQFTSGGECHEPEESIRQAARALIATALGAQTGAGAVKVGAYGSQSSFRRGDAVVTTNQLQITVELVVGFVE